MTRVFRSFVLTASTVLCLAACDWIASFELRDFSGDADSDHIRSDADTDADVDTTSDSGADADELRPNDADMDTADSAIDTDPDIEPDVEPDVEVDAEEVTCVPEDEIPANCIDEDCNGEDEPLSGATMDYFPLTPRVGESVFFTVVSPSRSHACVAMDCLPSGTMPGFQVVGWSDDSTDTEYRWSSTETIRFPSAGLWHCTFNRNRRSGGGCNPSDALDVVCEIVMVSE